MSKIALLNRVAFVLSFIGLFIAGTLSLAHHTGAGIACGGSSGCNEVAAYVQAKWNNFPVADVGLSGYIFLAVIAIFQLNVAFRPGMVRAGFIVAAIGTLASIALTAFSIAVIKTTCLYCIGSAITMTALAVVNFLIWRGVTEATPAVAWKLDKALMGVVAVAAIGGLVYGNNRGQVFATNLPDTIDALVPAKPNGIGNPKAEYILVEFFDPFCPFCRQSYKEMKAYVAQSNGRLYAVYRHFPLKMQGHEHSQTTANIAEIAADEGKFFNFYDALFEIEPKETTLDTVLAVADGLGIRKIADRAGVDTDPAFKRLYEDISAANNMGLISTPVIFFAKRGQKPETLNVMTYMKKLADLGLVSGP